MAESGSYSFFTQGEDFSIPIELFLWGWRAPKSRHLEGFVLLTFSSLQQRDVQKALGGCGRTGIVQGADPGLVRVDVRTCELDSRNLSSCALFWALQQHFPGDLGEVTSSLLTFISLPWEENFLCTCGLRQASDTFWSLSCHRNLISPHWLSWSRGQ